MQFINKYPEDKEWSAHVHLLNERTPEDMQLRHIVGYIKAGPHYPKHMHQDLIEQHSVQQQVGLLSDIVSQMVKGEAPGTDQAIDYLMGRIKVLIALKSKATE